MHGPYSGLFDRKKTTLWPVLLALSRLHIIETVLDQLSTYSSLESRTLRIERNSVAHGGNVIEDCRLIQGMLMHHNPYRGMAWKNAFERYYEVNFDMCQNFLSWTPKEIPEVLNILTSVKTLFH
jgi:hypothetical protein